MQNLMIKSHKPSSMYLGHYIFILNKGLNSGNEAKRNSPIQEKTIINALVKPMHEPCPNCFVMIFTSQEDKESYYWLSYSLWKAKFWHQHLVGSVIPFLRIHDFKKEFDNKTANMLQEQEAHLKNVKALQLLEQKEVQFHKNLALISDMKRVILYRYIKK